MHFETCLAVQAQESCRRDVVVSAREHHNAQCAHAGYRGQDFVGGVIADVRQEHHRHREQHPYHADVGVCVVCHANRILYDYYMNPFLEYHQLLLFFTYHDLIV